MWSGRELGGGKAHGLSDGGVECREAGAVRGTLCCPINSKSKAPTRPTVPLFHGTKRYNKNDKILTNQKKTNCENCANRFGVIIRE